MSIEQSQWNSEQLIFSGDQYFQMLIEAIDKAEIEVYLESYIFDLDLIGQKVIQHLAAAKQRGVEVRVLVDGIGSFNWLGPLNKALTELQIPFRIYHPLPFSLEKMRTIGWNKLRRWLYLFRRINRRNHRKVLIIDGHKAMLGSYNISQVHSEYMMGDKAWRDTGIALEGSSVKALRRAFIQAWGQSRFDNHIDPRRVRKPKIRSSPQSLIRLNSSLRWRWLLIRDLQRKMELAQRRILITNAYFLPRKSVLRNIRKAARRGIYVGLCIPAKSDVWFVKAATKSLYFRLLRDGVHIFEYQPTVLHAKTLIIDDWATVGSHNLNHRSLNHDLEAEAVITLPQNIQILVDNWMVDIDQSKKIEMRDLGKIGLLARLLSRFAYWFKYWI